MNIRIFHISDFHLNNKNLNDWNDYLKDAFIRYINDNKSEENFIVCSGDMVDKGGADFGGVRAGLEKFKESVIKPIVSQTGIPIDRFILAPGNHDINRNADEDYVISGVRDQIKNGGADKINDYTGKLLSGNNSPSKRVCDYFDFVELLYAGYSNVANRYLGSVFKYQIDDVELAYSCFNGVWNCCDDKDMEYGLAIGEPQYKWMKDLISDNTVKIAVMHHPLDWMKYERRTIQPWLRKDYSLLLMGHVHEGETMMAQSPSGSLIVNFSPSFTSDIRKDSITYQNGFTVIDYDIEGTDVDFTYMVYNHKQRKYILNNEYVESGTFHAEITMGDGDRLVQLMTRTVNLIKEKYIPVINSSLIPQKAKAISTLDEAFVMPPIKKNGDLEREEGYSLSTIINSQSNILLLGQHESGKTVLLYKILTELVENESTLGLVPVYFDFAEQTNQDIDTIIKNYLDCNTNEASLLIKERKIVLLVDNYDASDYNKDRIKKLYRFVADNTLRIIATTNHEIIDQIPNSIIQNNEILFEYYFIHQFSSSNVKELITRWSPELQRLERNQKIESLVNRFCSFSLPCTAMSVSLYLWSTENSNRDPVNPSVLLDIYMEIILERMSVEDMYVNTFDYDNKSSLLAFIAKSIHDEIKDDKPYTLTYIQYLSKVECYIKKVGFKGIDPTRLANYFIERKVFVLRNGNVEFAHACFYYFFLAKRMIKDEEFKNKVQSKDEYYKYDRVIEYYSGLARSDKALLKFLYEQFESVFEEVAFVHDEVDVDKHFTYIRKGQNGYTPAISRVNPEKVIENKPSEDTVDKRMLAIADEKLSKISDTFKQSTRLSPAALVLMLSRALRNMDGVEDLELKQSVYNSIIRNSVVLTVIVKDQLAVYANEHNGELPPAYCDIKNVGAFFRFMPFTMQMNLSEILATRKLVVFFENKLAADYKTGASDVEKYLSLAMLWDSTGLDNKKAITNYIKKIGKNSSQDYVLLKLLYNFDTKVVLGSEEEDEYIELLAILKAKQHAIKPIEKEKYKRQLKDARKRRMLSESEQSNKKA